MKLLNVMEALSKYSTDMIVGDKNIIMVIGNHKINFVSDDEFNLRMVRTRGISITANAVYVTMPTHEKLIIDLYQDAFASAEIYVSGI